VQLLNALMSNDLSLLMLSCPGGNIQINSRGIYGADHFPIRKMSIGTEVIISKSSNPQIVGKRGVIQGYTKREEHTADDDGEMWKYEVLIGLPGTSDRGTSLRVRCSPSQLSCTALQHVDGKWIFSASNAEAWSSFEGCRPVFQAHDDTPREAVWLPVCLGAMSAKTGRLITFIAHAMRALAYDRKGLCEWKTKYELINRLRGFDVKKAAGKRVCDLSPIAHVDTSTRLSLVAEAMDETKSSWLLHLYQEYPDSFELRLPKGSGTAVDEIWRQVHSDYHEALGRELEAQRRLSSSAAAVAARSSNWMMRLHKEFRLLDRVSHVGGSNSGKIKTWETKNYLEALLASMYKKLGVHKAETDPAIKAEAKAMLQWWKEVDPLTPGYPKKSEKDEATQEDVILMLAYADLPYPCLRNFLEEKDNHGFAALCGTAEEIQATCLAHVLKLHVPTQVHSNVMQHALGLSQHQLKWA